MHIFSPCGFSSLLIFFPHIYAFYLPFLLKYMHISNISQLLLGFCGENRILLKDHQTHKILLIGFKNDIPNPQTAAIQLCQFAQDRWFQQINHKIYKQQLSQQTNISQINYSTTNKLVISGRLAGARELSVFFTDCWLCLSKKLIIYPFILIYQSPKFICILAIGQSITYHIIINSKFNMRPVRGQRKSAIGSSHNIAVQKKGGKKEVQQPVEGIVNEEQDDEAQKIPEYARLTQQELNMTVTRTLVAVNPQAPVNKVNYDFFERTNKINDAVDNLAIHFSLEGDYIHTTSAEFKTQESIEETRKKKFNDYRAQAEKEEPGSGKNVEAIKQSMRNKFNYNGREVQTVYPEVKERGASTIPPTTENIRGEITQWEIWDTYIEDFKKEAKEDEKGQDKTIQKKAVESGRYSPSFLRCMKIMERMIRQNEEDAKYREYKYFWEEGEEPNPLKGDLLPIWRLQYEKKKKHVTSISWNPRYKDLFAISLGSYDFAKQKVGQILVWSIKNVTFPEFKYESLPTGVMCLDWHPESPSLLAAGLYDGTVVVYDVRNKHNKPIYESTVRTQKHTDPVWQVKWNPDITKKFNFYSISSDGRVMNWSLMKNKLEPEEIFKLKLVGEKEQETSFIGLACGLCFDFSKFDAFSFLVGTQEGKIHKCSLAYSGQYQETYKGHLLAVYKVRWNEYHPTTFISASADWTVRIWDSTYPNSQVMLFDMGMIVVDAVWAPYSSTIFACATIESVYIYDVDADKHSSLAERKPVRNPKLTNVCLNKTDPIILVGDTYGGVTVMKLSPNLLRRGPPKKEVQNPKNQPPPPTQAEIIEFERKKMDDLISLVSKWDRE